MKDVVSVAWESEISSKKRIREKQRQISMHHQKISTKNLLICGLGQNVGV